MKQLNTFTQIQDGDGYTYVYDKSESEIDPYNDQPLFSYVTTECNERSIGMMIANHIEHQKNREYQK